jgi:predicted alpha/beta-hydrolase family hydrolase
MTPFADASRTPAVRGFVHQPSGDPLGALVLTHGAGSNCSAQLLVALADAFAHAGYVVLRCDLAFRQARPHGSPFPAMAAQDRAGLENAVLAVQEKWKCPVFLGGHSYGGRQATMLIADRPGLVQSLLLLSYPLHPPRRPAELRTAHFPRMQTPALFVHGARDPFGSIEEMRAALALIPGRTALLEIEKAGHDLRGKQVPERAVTAFPLPI